VRIEILKAIALRVQTADLTAFCVANVAKPYLSVGPPKGRRTSYKFVDAIEAYCELLIGKDLVKAYERAGTRFSGRFSLYLWLFTDFPLGVIFLFVFRISDENVSRLE